MGHADHESADGMDASLATRVVRQKWLSGLVALCWAAFLVSNLIRGRVITTAIDGAACLVALAAWAWARASPETRLNVCAQITLASSALALSGAASVGGMSRSVALWYLGGVPLIAGYTLGVRSAVRWAGGCIALVIAVYVMEVRGAPEQEFVPLPAELVFGRVVLLALLAAFAVAARRASDLYVAALKQQQQLTKAHAAAVVRQAEELAAARDEALAAGKAKGAFLAAISHEIRTPLNAVVGVAELLGRGSVSADQRRMVETIERSGRSLARIVNDVLQFSKLEAGGNAVEVAPFDLARCLDDVVDMVGAQARERGLTTSEVMVFPSMVFADGEAGERNQLVSVKAASTGYPLRGELIIADAPFVRGTPTRTLPGPGEVWLDSRLFPALGIKRGDQVEVGMASLQVTQVLVNEPDRGGSFFDMGPRLLMNLADVPATEVVQPGSRLNYRLLLAGPEATLDTLKDDLPLAAGHRWVGIREASPRVGDALDRAESFLLLGGLLGVLLAGVAVALSAHRYAKRHYDHVGVLKTLGATPSAIARGYLGLLLIVGGIAILIGLLAGGALHFAIVGALGALLTGVFASRAVNGAIAEGKAGLLEGNSGQVLNQAIGIAIAWGIAIVGTLVILKICDVVCGGVRVSTQDEVQGLDLSQHGEEGYSLEG